MADPQPETVYVTVAGLTGTGKSAVSGEIEIALKAIGLTVEHHPSSQFPQDKRMTNADWFAQLENSKPKIVMTEINIPRVRNPTP